MAKRIAIFNGFPFHYEMFGCVFEFLTNAKLAFSVYSERTDEMGWFSVYTSRFGAIPIHPIQEYDPSNYDYVFLLTDDDFKYKLQWNSAKIIMFEHHGLRNVARFAHRRIQTRFFTRRLPPPSPDSWVMPVWTIFQKPTPKLSQIVHIVAIGNNCPANPDELRPWFDTLSSYKFTFINRDPAPTRFDYDSWAPYSNVTVLTNIDTNMLLETAAAADWCLLLPKNGNQLHNSISAIIPIAYGVGTPLLMPNEWGIAYGLGGIRPLDPSNPVEKPNAAVLQELFDTKEALVKRRDSVFETCLQVECPGL